MKFTEKNNFVVKHTSQEHFSKDRELFKVHCPNSRLHTDLKRVNSFNRKKLDGLILWELLEKVSPEEVLKNREEKPVETKGKVIIENIEQVKEKLVEMGIDPVKVSEEFIQTNIGMSVEEFESLYSKLKDFLNQDGVAIHTLNVPPPADEQESTEGNIVTKKGKESDPKSKKDSLQIEALKERISALEETADYNTDDIDALRMELDDKEAVMEEISAKIEALETKALKKKEANKRNSRK
jgi:uncharacterized coiled-coil protein SlyX